MLVLSPSSLYHLQFLHVYLDVRILLCPAYSTNSGLTRVKYAFSLMAVARAVAPMFRFRLWWLWTFKSNGQYC